MAFSFDFSLCSTKSCTNIQFTDTSVDWPSATIAIGDAVYVLLTLTDVNSISESYDVSSVFAAATDQSDLVYNSEDYNGGPYSDGKYTATYEIYDVVGGNLLYSKTIEFYIYCNMDCCIEATKLKLKDYIDCDNCDTDYVINYFKMKALLMSLRIAVKFGNFTEAQNIYDVLQDMCDFKNCNCS